MTDERRPIGATAGATGISPRMLRYLEAQGVVRPDRNPGPHHGPHPGARHFPPHEVRIARVAGAAMQAGAATSTLAALRKLADRRVTEARRSADPLAWYDLLVLAAAVQEAAHADDPDVAAAAGPGHRPPRR
jgi:hypothetical protein